jgi:hypothetical protein
MNASRCTSWLIVLGLSFMPPRAAYPGAPDESVGRHNVAFTEYSPLTRTRDFLQRALTPLAAQAIERRLTDGHEAVAEQPVDLSKENFVIYVPPQRPANGYGLMVFVPPWQQATLPSGWAGVLDQHGVIFVSAARSGNDENVITRRVPLALIAAHNVIMRYAVDPKRIFVGGFSGGSRVALRLAVEFPDVFRGAFLNAGSDPIGVDPVAPPAKNLLRLFQESSRLVYVTGVSPRFETPSVAIGLAATLGALYAWENDFAQLAGKFVLAIWPFYALAVAAVFMLRRRRPDLARPYRTWGTRSHPCSSSPLRSG